MSQRIFPLQGIHISTKVDGVEVLGKIVALYPNDMTVVLSAPGGCRSCGLHAPYFAMGHSQLATSTALTPYGRDRAEWLLKQAYNHFRGVTVTWPVDVA